MAEVRNLDTIRKEFHDLMIEVIGLRTELKGFKDTIENIFIIIYGDGTAIPILTKVALNSSEIEKLKVIIPTEVKEIKEDIDSIRSKFATSDQVKELKEDIKSIKSDKMSLLTATISGCLGLIAAIVLGILQFLKKGS